MVIFFIQMKRQEKQNISWKLPTAKGILNFLSMIQRSFTTVPRICTHGIFQLAKRCSSQTYSRSHLFKQANHRARSHSAVAAEAEEEQVALKRYRRVQFKSSG